jgi:hypothetical protein
MLPARDATALVTLATVQTIDARSAIQNRMRRGQRIWASMPGLGFSRITTVENRKTYGTQTHHPVVM